MVLSSVLAFSRTQALTDSNGLTDANGVIFATEAVVDFHRRLVEKGVDASGLQESSVLTSAGINNYPSNPSLLALKTIEVNYTDTNNNNYKVASQVDFSNLPAGTSFSWLRGNGSMTFPQFDDRGNTYEILPTPTTPTMVRIMYFAQPSVYSSVSDTVAYPENTDAAILGWRIAANYLYSLGSGKIPDGDKFMQRYEDRVKQYIDTLSRGSQQPLKATGLIITGFEF